MIGPQPRAPRRLFLLSPASCRGERARLFFNDGARFDLARRLRTTEGVPLGEVFSFLSGLYFRGKLRYAHAFARPPRGVPGVLVITPGHGLRPPETRVDLDVLQQYATVRIDADDPRYTEPLLRDARALATMLARHAACEVVLLGSVASGKYVDVLGPALGARFRFPAEFVGRGDMSRGGLMLRCTEAGRELTYVTSSDTPRRGPRPPRLVPNPGILKRAGRS